MSRKHLDLSQELLKCYLIYDPDTGVFTRKVSINNNCRRGDVAGTISRGYVTIAIEGVRYRAHRLAWLYMHGELPNSEIDHVNRNRQDNRISNLRLCTGNENAVNRSMRSDNSSGYRGVSFYKALGKWSASARINKQTYHIGYYSTPLEASRAYHNFIKEKHGEFYVSLEEEQNTLRRMDESNER